MEIRLAELIVGERKIRIHVDGLATLVDRVVVEMRDQQELGQFGIDDQRQRIEASGFLHFRDRFAVSTLQAEVPGVPVVGGCVSGIQLDRALEFLSGGFPIPIEAAQGARHAVGSFDTEILPHLDAAHNFARWLMRNRADAADVFQEACLKAFRYFGTFRGGNARAWLLRIVRTTSFGWSQKQRGRQLETEFDEQTHGRGGDAPTPEDFLLQRADSLLVDQGMRQLPDRLRDALVLRELEGLSYKELAEVLGVPIGTVMSTLSRARERLRRALGDLVRRQAATISAAPVSDLRHPAGSREGINTASNVSIT